MNAVTKLKTEAERGLAAQFQDVRAHLPGAAVERAAAFAAFEQAGLPHRRVEAWHYTDLRALMHEALPLVDAGLSADAIAAAGETLARATRLGGPRFVFVDGMLAPGLSDMTHGVEGLSLTPLGEAISRGDALTPSLQGADDDAVVALNAAFMQDGIVLTIAPGVTIAAPIEIVSLSLSTGRASFARSALTLGAGACATLVERAQGAAGQRNNAIVIALGDDAQLDHVAIVDERVAQTVHLDSALVTLGARTKLSSIALVMGQGLIRRQMFLRFAGEHARAFIGGAALLRGREHADSTLVVEHVAPHCESRELFKHILCDRATGVFQGKIIVAPGAQKTDGKMMSKAILLSDEAVMNNKPELEIFADDVVCGHGATVGALDEDQLFYAQSRGIPLAEAESLLLDAFIGDLLDQVANEPLRDQMRASVADWLNTRGTA